MATGWDVSGFLGFWGTPCSHPVGALCTLLGGSGGPKSVHLFWLTGQMCVGGKQVG